MPLFDMHESHTGLFISFEGGEGSGKSTQVRKLSDALQKAGREVVVTREPGGTPEAEKVRNLLVQRDGGEWSAQEECLLVLTARAHHVRKVIRPALNRGCIVICDRFIDSTIAYQGYGRDMPLADIAALHDVVLGSFEPNMTFLLDLPVMKGLERSEVRLAREGDAHAQQEDRFERMEIAFHEKLRAGFLKIAEQNSARVHVLDATQGIETLHDLILKSVQKAVKG